MNDLNLEQQSALKTFPKFLVFREKMLGLATGDFVFSQLQEVMNVFFAMLMEHSEDCLKCKDTARKVLLLVNLTQIVNQFINYFKYYFDKVKRVKKLDRYFYGMKMAVILGHYFDLALRARRTRPVNVETTGFVEYCFQQYLADNPRSKCAAVLSSKYFTDLTTLHNRIGGCIPILEKILEEVKEPARKPLDYIIYLASFQLLRDYHRNEKEKRRVVDKTCNVLPSDRIFAEELHAYSQLIPIPPPEQKTNVTRYYMNYVDVTKIAGAPLINETIMASYEPKSSKLFPTTPPPQNEGDEVLELVDSDDEEAIEVLDLDEEEVIKIVDEDDAHDDDDEVVEITDLDDGRDEEVIEILDLDDERDKSVDLDDERDKSVDLDDERDKSVDLDDERDQSADLDDERDQSADLDDDDNVVSSKAIPSSVLPTSLQKEAATTSKDLIPAGDSDEGNDTVQFSQDCPAKLSSGNESGSRRSVIARTSDVNTVTDACVPLGNEDRINSIVHILGVITITDACEPKRNDSRERTIVQMNAFKQSSNIKTIKDAYTIQDACVPAGDSCKNSIARNPNGNTIEDACVPEDYDCMNLVALSPAISMTTEACVLNGNNACEPNGNHGHEKALPQTPGNNPNAVVYESNEGILNLDQQTLDISMDSIARIPDVNFIEDASELNEKDDLMSSFACTSSDTNTISGVVNETDNLMNLITDTFTIIDANNNASLLALFAHTSNINTIAGVWEQNGNIRLMNSTSPDLNTITFAYDPNDNHGGVNSFAHSSDEIMSADICKPNGYDDVLNLITSTSDVNNITFSCDPNENYGNMDTSTHTLDIDTIRNACEENGKESLTNSTTQTSHENAITFPCNPNENYGDMNSLTNTSDIDTITEACKPNRNKISMNLTMQASDDNVIVDEGESNDSHPHSHNLTNELSNVCSIREYYETFGINFANSDVSSPSVSPNRDSISTDASDSNEVRCVAQNPVSVAETKKKMPKLWVLIYVRITVMSLLYHCFDVIVWFWCCLPYDYKNALLDEKTIEAAEKEKQIEWLTQESNDTETTVETVADKFEIEFPSEESGDVGKVVATDEKERIALKRPAEESREKPTAPKFPKKVLLKKYLEEMHFMDEQYPKTTYGLVIPKAVDSVPPEDREAYEKDEKEEMEKCKMILVTQNNVAPARKRGRPPASNGPITGAPARKKGRRAVHTDDAPTTRKSSDSTQKISDFAIPEVSNRPVTRNNGRVPARRKGRRARFAS